MTTVRLGPWPAGMNSVLPDHVEPTKTTPLPLRNAVNVDVTDEGKVRRRVGMTQVIPGTKVHSLWTDGVTTFIVVDGVLNTVTSSLSLVPAYSGFGTGHVAYASAAGDTYMTDGTKYLKHSGGVVAPAGVETPARQVLLTAGVGGALAAGTYAVACTYVDASGTESGSSLRTSITVAADGYIQLTQIPVPIAANIALVRIYITPPDGTTLYHEADVVPGATAAAVYSVGSSRTVLRTELMDPLPAGTSLAHTKGRMFTAVGNVVYFSEPLRYGLCNIGDNFLMFPAPVTLLVANQDGLFICADKTYYLADLTPDNTSQKNPLRVVLPCGAVANSATAVPDSTNVAWLSTRGMVVGAMDGSVKALTDGVIAERFYGSGATLHREQDGIKQLISTASGASETSLAAASYMTAEVIRGKTQ